jgi:hypothetical protein
VVFREPGSHHSDIDRERRTMYQQIMYDVHRQWLREFDREAALRRQLPRRKRSLRPGWLKLAFRRTRPTASRPPAVAGAGAQAPQCA